MKRLLMISLVAGALMATGAEAQDDEIVVTGSRISSYNDDFLPVIYEKRRADFMVANVVVESDSRDYALRRDEVLKTLRAMADRADNDSKIDLGLLRTFETDDDEIAYVEPFTRAIISSAILSGGQRADTTRATIVVKTPISESDSYDGAKARIEAFTGSVPETGRAQLIDDDEPGLSIVNIGQYRVPLLKALAADNAAVRSTFGEDYRVSISGLEQPVRWRVTGPLELAIYFPYASSVAPKAD